MKTRRKIANKRHDRIRSLIGALPLPEKVTSDQQWVEILDVVESLRKDVDRRKT